MTITNGSKQKLQQIKWEGKSTGFGRSGMKQVLQRKSIQMIFEFGSQTMGE